VPTISEPVRRALDAGGAVVALESTIIAHGLPRPRNHAVALELEAAVRAAGAVPATIAVLDGEPCIGLDEDGLARVATTDIAKLSVRDLALAAARRADGATTVAATAHLAAHVGIRVFATGGLGGVHRDARESWDESADLLALARTPITVVAAGVKSILDVGATLERLETLGVAVAGWRTNRFPGFYLTDGGFDVDWSVDRPDEVAAAMAAADALGVESALVVANPVDPARQLDPDEHERVLADGLERARAAGITGKAVTPFLLDHLHRATDGRSLEVNIAVARGNAAVAGAIAAAWAARS
jgi:pseudouridylate synthase